MTNNLYYGDNLQVLRESFAEQSVDLIYLDPPFNSSANYNVLFKSPTGKQSAAQIEAFKDTWHWTSEAESAFDEVMKSARPEVFEMLRAMRSLLRENDMMAYLTMMAIRLIELHRILKDTGSLYLHCDSTASHYLKILLDAVFGKHGYRNEIIWKRTSAHSDGKHYGKNTDTIFFYTKSDNYTWNKVFSDYTEKYLARFRNQDDDGRLWTDGDLSAKGLVGGGYTYEYKGVTSLWRVPLISMERLDAEGRLHFTKNNGIRLKRYLDESEGSAQQALWTDIPPINSQAQERLGYPTQKPLALLERIIETSSNPGDVVLDPFCGCGTAVHAAERLRRKWAGIDITHLAISLIERRLNDAFPKTAFTVHGTPRDVEGARALATKDKYQFQWWAVSLVGAVPFGGKKKGADGGIDGLIFFRTGRATSEKVIVSVKGEENVSVAMIRDLGHVVEREKAKVGLFLTLANPTSEMEKEAVKAGNYENDQGRFPKIQILTIAELFDGKRPLLPLIDSSAFEKAACETDAKMQGKLNV